MRTRPLKLAFALTFAVVVTACGGGSSGNQKAVNASSNAGSTATSSPASTSSSSSTASDPNELAGCVPSCRRGFTTPGAIAGGVYTTKNFFGGRMKVTLDGGWRSDEDSTGEFRAEFTAMPNNILWFWEDVYPVENGTQVANVPMTAKGLLDWFQSTPRLSISNVTTGAIGTLPATVVDVQASASTPNEDPNDCPSAPCVNFLGFPQWDGPWGIAAGQLQRFYLADVTYGGRQHLFVAVIYPNTVEEMDAFEPVAATALASVDVPAKPA